MWILQLKVKGIALEPDPCPSTSYSYKGATPPEVATVPYTRLAATHVIEVLGREGPRSLEGSLDLS